VKRLPLLLGVLVWLGLAAAAGGAPPSAPGINQTVTPDGAWCWFSDPRAIRHDGKLYAGWMNSQGSVQVGCWNPATGLTQTATLAEKFERDDHDHPSLLFLPDGRLLAFYSLHAKGDMHLRMTTNPEDISAWTPDRTLHFENPGAGPHGVTYSDPMLLSAEHNALYVFWRGSDFKPTFSVSRDFGQTWSIPQILIKRRGAGTDNRPYSKEWTDGRGRIDFIFTDGHPRNEPTNSVYFLRYENGAFFKADGTKIGTWKDLPFDPAQCDRVYDGATHGRAWVWGVAEDGQGRPVVVYTRLPQEQDHRYHYARWDGQQWLDDEITPAGQWFPQTPAGKTEPEPHYSGGLALDPADPATVYLSRPVHGTFEIEKWVTPDGGKSWQSAPITQNSTVGNVRPFVVVNPTGGPSAVMWMSLRGHYTHYTDFDTALEICWPPSPASPPRKDAP
jgi:hypothetical protein